MHMWVKCKDIAGSGQGRSEFYKGQKTRSWGGNPQEGVFPIRSRDSQRN